MSDNYMRDANLYDMYEKALQENDVEKMNAIRLVKIENNLFHVIQALSKLENLILGKGPSVEIPFPAECPVNGLQFKKKEDLKDESKVPENG